MNLSKLQEKIINSSHNKIVVLSSAASGKTRLMTEKVRQILRNGVDPKEIAVITFTNMAAAELKERLGEDYKPGLFVGTIHALANYFLLSAGISTGSVLDNEDFDKLFLMVNSNPGCVKHLKWILLDEAQDSDEMQFKFLFNMINPENFFVCGDTKQCQPEGTKIWLRNGIVKNIEDISVGDDIVWYENKTGRCSSLNTKAYNTKHKHVLEVSKREFKEDYLMTITTDNNYTSSYTPNHRVFMSMKPDTEYQHTVYLMCDANNRFRVGKIPLFGTKTKNGAPWKRKMQDEKCDKIWLLKVFKTDKEARVFEQKVSYKYQIPQICWQTDKVSWTKEDIDYIYEDLNTYESAKQCLKDFKLSIYYPMYTNNIEWLHNQKFANNAIFQIYAINIFDEIMDCWIYDNNTTSHSYKARKSFKLDKQYIKNPINVYSLRTEGETYVADGILTHNCIYQFKGSEPKLLLDLTEQDGVYTYDMNENYRNGSRILSFARRLIQPTGQEDTSIPMRVTAGEIFETKFNPNGIIYEIKKKPQYENWAILCRTNAQISKVSEILRSAGLPFETFRQGDLTKDELITKLKQNTIKVLTVHSAKGLEWDNVIVYGMRYYNAEERNICYVAATRARNFLMWVK